MEQKKQIVSILLAYARKRLVHTSTVILELFADVLIDNGITFVVHCDECKHRTDDGHCYQDVATPGYKRTHDKGYCDRGEKKDG